MRRWLRKLRPLQYVLVVDESVSFWKRSLRRVDGPHLCAVTTSFEKKHWPPLSEAQTGSSQVALVIGAVQRFVFLCLRRADNFFYRQTFFGVLCFSGRGGQNPEFTTRKNMQCCWWVGWHAKQHSNLFVLRHWYTEFRTLSRPTPPTDQVKLTFLPLKTDARIANSTTKVKLQHFERKPTLHSIPRLRGSDNAE